MCDESTIKAQARQAGSDVSTNQILSLPISYMRIINKGQSERMPGGASHPSISRHQPAPRQSIVETLFLTLGQEDFNNLLIVPLIL